MELISDLKRRISDLRKLQLAPEDDLYLLKDDLQTPEG